MGDFRLMRLPNGDYEFVEGQRIGLKDIVEQEMEERIEWYTLLAIEIDDELPLAWFYLKSETDKLNNKDGAYGKYAEIIESISERIIVDD